MTHTPPKLVAFDLDGVLTDTRETHVLALETALEMHGFPIQRERLWELDGLSTRQRLWGMIDIGLLPADEHLVDLIDATKARITDQIIARNGVTSLLKHLEPGLRMLCSDGAQVCVVSNARRSTVELCVNGLGKASQYIKFFVCGDDEGNERKPSPVPYLRACEIAGVRPHECVAIDDNYNGRSSARRAGVRLLPFDRAVSMLDVIRFCRTGSYPTTIVVPMAGRGQRFIDAGYDRIKPLIDVDGRPMIQWVLGCLPTEANFVFILPPSTEPKAGPEMEEVLAAIRPNSVSLRVPDMTEGAACTVLLAEKHVWPGGRLIVANCDQLVDVDWDQVLQDTADEAGFVLTFKAHDPKWSYAVPYPDDPRHAAAFVEKRPVGERATCGVYGVRRASDLFEAIRAMIRCDDRTNGEFYLCPALNYIAGDIVIVPVEEPYGMVGLGTPEDLRAWADSIDY